MNARTRLSMAVKGKGVVRASLSAYLLPTLYLTALVFAPFISTPSSQPAGFRPVCLTAATLRSCTTLLAMTPLPVGPGPGSTRVHGAKTSDCLSISNVVEKDVTPFKNCSTAAPMLVISLLVVGMTKLSQGDLKFVVTLSSQRHCIHLDEIQEECRNKRGIPVSITTLLFTLPYLHYSAKRSLICPCTGKGLPTK